MTALERDFPVGHPAAGDYAGQHYDAPRAPYGEDFRKGHPARDGGNTKATDTPDGMRVAIQCQQQDVNELVAIGAIPVDREHEADTLCPGGTPEEKAYAFLEQHGYSNQAALNLIEHVGAARILASEASGKG
jgi:hypothetical protein